MTRERHDRLVYSVIGVVGLAYAFYRGYLVFLPVRLSTFDSWQVGDWLIDYSGGLVRRGFSGEVVFLIASQGADALALVVITQTVFAAVLFVLVGVLYWQTNRGPVWLMLVLSPAFLLFPALDAMGNARKDLIVLVALALAAVFHRAQRTKLGLWVSFPIFALGVLSHEAMVVTLAAFAYLAFTSLGTKKAWPVVAAYIIPSIFSVIVALVRSGDAQTVDLICQTWNSRGLTNCGGALAALDVSATDMINKISTQGFPEYWSYLLAVAMAALPFFALRYFPREQLIGWIIVLAGTPLFFIGWDYGRWIFIIVAQLSLLVLARPERTQPMRVPLYAALAFILLWGFDHAGSGNSAGLGVRWLSSFLS